MNRQQNTRPLLLCLLGVSVLGGLGCLRSNTNTGTTLNPDANQPSLIVLLNPPGVANGSNSGGNQSPITGQPLASMLPFEQTLVQTMAAHGIPGAAVAVMKDGRLVYARGFGFADVAQGRLVQPDELGRIGSVSKVFTCYAAMLLSQNGQLDLQNKLFASDGSGYLSDLRPSAALIHQPAWVDAMTVQSHLQMASGWPKKLGDLLYAPLMLDIPSRTGTLAPTTASASVTYALEVTHWLGSTFDSPVAAPYTQSEYTDLSYCTLGRVIEKVLGQPYDSGAYASFVQANVLTPLGITAMAQGNPLYDPAAAAQNGEMIYYPLTPLETSVNPALTSPVTPAYSGDYWLPSHDSTGGWIASPVDMLRLVRAIENTGQWPGPVNLLTPSNSALLFARPIPGTSTEYLAMGWQVNMVQDAKTGQMVIGKYYKPGDFPGCTAWVQYYPQPGAQTGYAIIFNADVAKDKAVLDAILQELETVITTNNNAQNWPTYDLFPQYPR